MNVFGGILVVLFGFEMKWKLYAEYITLSNGSLVVFAYEVTLHLYMNKLS